MLKTDGGKREKVKKKVHEYSRVSKFILRIPGKIVDFIIESLSKSYRFSLSFRITFSFFIISLFNFVLFIVYFVFFMRSHFVDKEFIVDVVKMLIIVSAVLLTLIFVFGKYTCNRVLSPIADITEEMKHISSKNLNYRIDPSQTKDELRELVEYFNSMMDEIELSYHKKNQFVSDASHELRTPISVIGGYMNMLKRWGKEDGAILEEAIEAVSDEAEQMKSLVEKLLFLARSDRNKIEFEMVSVDIKSILKEMVKETKVVFPGKVIRYSENSDSDVFVLGSREMIKQMLRVFLENSLKFTDDDGEIELFVNTFSKRVEFGVKDNGIGIPEKDLPYIFDRFYKVDKSRTNKVSGSGLGLSIAKLIISAHAADVHVSSSEGAGTVVSISMSIL